MLSGYQKNHASLAVSSDISVLLLALIGFGIVMDRLYLFPKMHLRIVPPPNTHGMVFIFYVHMYVYIYIYIHVYKCISRFLGMAIPSCQLFVEEVKHVEPIPFHIF